MLTAKINVISKKQSKVHFGQKTNLSKIPTLNEYYKTEKSRNNTLTGLGSSRHTNNIQKFIELAEQFSSEMTKKGYNILTGCGNDGIMGALYRGSKNGQMEINSGENLAIIRTPLWGDEDLKNCKVIGKATSEAERIQKFKQCSDTFLIFPGGTTSLQEATTLIQGNVYDKPKKRIILSGEDFFKGLIDQYKRLKSDGLIKTSLSDLFSVANSPKDILKNIPKLMK